jgi:hypothetical protein
MCIVHLEIKNLNLLLQELVGNSRLDLECIRLPNHRFLHIIRFQSLDFPDFHLFVQETMKRNKLCKHIHLVVQSFHV